MMENYQTLTSPDGSRNTPERCPCPLYSWDSSQEHQVISEEDQNEDSIIVEVKEEVEDTFMTDDKLYKEEEVISPEISTDPGDSQRNVKAEEWDEGRVRIKEEEIHIKITTDGSSNRNTPERSPHPLCSQDSPQEHQAKNVLICKAEVKEEAEYPSVMDSDPCKEEEIPSEISTDRQYSNRGKHLTVFSYGIIENDDIPVGAPKRSRRNPVLCSTIHREDLSSDFSTLERSFPDTSPCLTPHTDCRSNEIFLLCKPGECFTQEEDLFPHQHQLLKHPGTHSFSCLERTSGFSEKSKLSLHQTTHSGEKPFSCSECGDSFSRKSSLTMHIKIHTREKPYSCSECGRSFCQRSKLLHQRTHKGLKSQSCSECSKWFSLRLSRLSHQMTYAGEKPHSYLECENSFAEKSNLTTHQKTHLREKPHSCPECGKSFAEKLNLTMHQQTHLREKPYSCPECPKRFSRKTSLSRHKQLHTGKKLYSCSQCGKCCTDRSSLVRHLMTHSGEKPYSCSACGKFFSQKSSLLRHEKDHMG